MKRVFRSVDLAVADAVDRGDLKRSSPQERLDSVERMRRMVFGYDDNPPRLERVLTNTSLDEHKISSDWRPRPRFLR